MRTRERPDAVEQWRQVAGRLMPVPVALLGCVAHRLFDPAQELRACGTTCRHALSISQTATAVGRCYLEEENQDPGSGCRRRGGLRGRDLREHAPHSRHNRLGEAAVQDRQAAMNSSRHRRESVDTAPAVLCVLTCITFLFQTHDQRRSSNADKVRVGDTVRQGELSSQRRPAEGKLTQ